MKKEMLVFFLLHVVLGFKSYSQQKTGTAFIVTQYEVGKTRLNDSVMDINYNSIICFPHDQEAAGIIRSMVVRKRRGQLSAIEWIEKISKYGDLMLFVSKMPVTSGSISRNIDAAAVREIFMYDSIHPGAVSTCLILPKVYMQKSYMKVYEINYEGLFYTFNNYSVYHKSYYADNALQQKVAHIEYSKSSKRGKVEADSVVVQYNITLNDYFKNYQPLKAFIEVNGTVLKEYPYVWLKH